MFKNILYVCASLALLGLGYYYGIDLPSRQNEKIRQEKLEQSMQLEAQQRYQKCAKIYWDSFNKLVNEGMNDREAYDLQKYVYNKIQNECGL